MLLKENANFQVYFIFKKVRMKIRIILRLVNYWSEDFWGAAMFEKYFGSFRSF